VGVTDRLDTGALLSIGDRGAELVPITRAEEARTEAKGSAHLGERRTHRLREALTVR
jgi:hypothetical protein